MKKQEAYIKLYGIFVKIMNFINEEESSKILNYIKNNSDNDNPLSFEIELLFNSNGIG